VELEGLTPDAFRDRSVTDVQRLAALVGNQTVELGELFRVTGDPADQQWRLTGDLSGVHGLGARMRDGELRVEGNVGRHAGSEMRGGTLHVSGDAGDWLGAEMRGGTILLAGDAGHSVGAAYAGSPRGMRGGSIVVRGSAGQQVGHTMRRGWITIAGNCGPLAGYRMRAGSLFVLGACDVRPGAEMLRGTIGLFGGGPLGAQRPTLLPTFRPACKLAPQFMGLMRRQLQTVGIDVPNLDVANLDVASKVEIYNGDFLRGGRGEILLPAT